MNVAAYIVTALFLGSNWYATRVTLQGYKPITAAALRFGIASVIFIALWFANRVGTKPDRKELNWLALAGVLNAVQYGLFYFALQWISGGLAAVIFGTVQLFTAIVAIVTRTEKVTFASVAGAPLSIVGLALIYGDQLKLSSLQAKGVALMFASVIVSAIQTIILKHHGRRVGPMATTTIFLTMSAIALGIGAVVHEHEYFAIASATKPNLALLYQGLIGSAAAFGVYFFMLKRVSAMTAASIAFVLPVVALAIDWIAGESMKLTTVGYFGVALTLLGVVVGVLIKFRAAPTARKV